jgi:hypothetical protein
MAFSDVQEISGEPLAEASQEPDNDVKPRTQIGKTADANVNNFR